MTTYAGNDRGRYEPPACPRCLARPRVEWREIFTYFALGRWVPAYALCQTPGCVDDKGGNEVPL